MVFDVSMDFGDPEPVVFTVEASDPLQATFIASTMMGSMQVVSHLLNDNMHLDVRPLAESFNETWPVITVEEQK